MGGMVLVIEASNDETVMSLMLKVGLGNARTKTVKAFTAEKGIKIIELGKQHQETRHIGSHA